MTRAILCNFRNYTIFGKEFYEPMLEFFMLQMAKYQNEFDMLYLLDSQWDIGSVKESWGISKVKIIKVNSSLTYSDAYKEVLPQVKEDLVLFMDNDMIVYKPEIIRDTFDTLEKLPLGTGIFDVVSIIDQIGEYKTDKLKNGNKFCSYWFATRKELLMKYLDIDWNSHMPHSETLGLLTEAMLNDEVKVYEWEEDKSSLLFDGSESYSDNIGKGKNLGYYHVRGGSTPAYLLATKKYGDIETYNSYLKNQPKNEYLRQFMWYAYMLSELQITNGGDYLADFLNDVGITMDEWFEYGRKFKEYHGL